MFEGFLLQCFTSDGSQKHYLKLGQKTRGTPPWRDPIFQWNTILGRDILYSIYTIYPQDLQFHAPKRMKSRCLTIDELLWRIWPGSFVACFKSSLWPDHRITDVSFGPFPYAALVINVTQDQFSCGVTMSALKRGRKLRKELWNRQVWTMKCETLFYVFCDCVF